jgi:hypothetical protein
VLVAEPFEDPLRRMPLLPRPPLILQQDLVDDTGERIQLGTHRRPAPPVLGWHRKRQHLRYRPRVDPKTPRRFPPAHNFNLNRKTNLSPEAKRAVRRKKRPTATKAERALRLEVSVSAGSAASFRPYPSLDPHNARSSSLD